MPRRRHRQMLLLVPTIRYYVLPPALITAPTMGRMRDHAIGRLAGEGVV
jgi:hypothetical protein